MKTILLYLLVLAVVGGACNTPPAEEKRNPEDTTATAVSLTAVQMRNAGIELDTPEQRSVHVTLRASGKVDVPPQSMVSVSFPMGGYLKNTTLLPGLSVRKGQVIGIMEDQGYVQLQQDYLAAKARMEYLSADVQRQKELSEGNATSIKNYQLVQSEFKVQLVMLKSLEEKLRIIGIQPATLSVNNLSRDVPIYSPINGFVAKVNVNIGKYVNPADVLFELVNPDDIHAAMTVFEKDLAAFKPGMKGKVFLNDDPGKQYEVEVILVTRNVDDNQAGLVHCHFENRMHALLPGMFLSGVFELDTKVAITVPAPAVVRYGGKEYVFTAGAGNQFNMTPVITGGTQNGFTVLSGGADRNWLTQPVVVKGAYALLGKLRNRMEE